MTTAAPSAPNESESRDRARNITEINRIGNSHLLMLMRTQAATGFADLTPVRISAASLKDPLRILASISDDLQTPLTRMKLRAEAMNESVERRHRRSA